MDRRDRLALWRPFPIGVIKVNRERDRIDVDENDVGAEVMKCGGRRRERQRRHQNRVAKPYAAGFSSQVDPCGGRIDRHGLDPASEKICEALFELAAFASSREPPGLKDGDRGLDLPIADRRLKKRDAHAQPLSHAAIDPHRRACSFSGISVNQVEGVVEFGSTATPFVSFLTTHAGAN